MPASGPRAVSTAEVEAQLRAERAGHPFLVYRDGAGEQRVVTLDPEADRLWVGRALSTDIRLEWDTEVSGLHAQLERGGEEWTLVDDGLSRNGSYVNGERVRGRRRLRDGDMPRFGHTVMLYRTPGREELPGTALSDEVVTAASLSAAQRRVLVALCRPFKDGGAFATPASNPEIAEELFISVEAVKTHMRTLFQKFGVEDLPQTRKRLALVERALQSGVLTERDL
jgi:FHA domain/Bacterial regulatory proteins, luxR family